MTLSACAEAGMASAAAPTSADAVIRMDISLPERHDARRGGSFLALVSGVMWRAVAAIVATAALGFAAAPAEARCVRAGGEAAFVKPTTLSTAMLYGTDA